MDAIIFPLISAKRHANNVDFREERYILEKVVYQLNFNQSVIDPVESKNNIVKLRQGSGKEGQGMALKAKGLKA